MLTAHQVTVGESTPVDLTNGEDVSKKYEIRLRTGGQLILLGPATVSESSGYVSGEFVAQLEDERIYGVTASGSGEVTVGVLMFTVS